MKLKFYYFFNSLWKVILPSCKSFNNEKKEEIISNYLKDCSLAFANKVIQNLNCSCHDILDVSTESWSAELLDGNIIEVRALHDYDNLDYVDYIARADFTKILEKWQEFLKREPDENYEEIITFEIEELDREELLEIWNKELLLTHRKNKMTVIAGGHSALGNIRVDRVIHKYRNGVYIAQVSVLDPVTEQYIAKSNNNGETVMFPEYWTADRIKVEINSAYYNQIEILNTARKAEGMWMGISTSGVKIEGYTYPKVTAFPSIEQD